jgi:hypothetical protein
VDQLIPVAKTNFAAGEIAPSIHAQLSLPQHAAGLKTLKNAIAFPGGGVGNRAGSEYIYDAKPATFIPHLVSFTFTDGVTYVLEVEEYYIRFYRGGVIVKSGGSPYEVATPYQSNLIPFLDFKQSADVIVITSPYHQQRLLTYHSDTNWILSNYDYENGPFMPLNFDAASTITPSAATGNIVLTAANNIFSNITGEDHASNRFGALGQSTSIKCGGTWRIVTHGTWTGTIQIEVSLDGGTSWIPIRSLASNNTQNYNTYGAEDYSQFLIRVKCTAYTSGAILVDLSSDPFLWRGVVKITQVPSGGGGASQMYSTADATVLTTLASTGATADWAEGAWSNYRGYPAVATYYQDRLVFANTLAEPQTLWFSKTGIYQDFGRSSPLLDSDGITINLPGRELSAITGLALMGGLVVLTTSEQWTIKAPTDGVLTPTNMEIKPHGTHGAYKGTAPLVIGDRLLYIQDGGRAIRDAGYSEEVGGFLGEDLSKFAPHLFEGGDIRRLEYQRTPYGLIWVYGGSGTLSSLTYDRAHNICSWTQHEMGGIAREICVVHGDDGDELWLVEGGQDAKKRITRIRGRSLSARPEDQFYVDWGKRWKGYNKVITGITTANPAVFSFAYAGAINNGDVVRLDGIVGENSEKDGGMGLLNDVYYNVYDVSGTTCKLKVGAAGSTPLDTSAMGNYKSGGIIDEATHTVAGLNWLDGREVSVLVDGMPETHTIASNTLTLDSGKYGALIHVGLKYISDVEILPVNLTDKQSLFGMKVDIPTLVVWLLKSLGGKAGYDEDHLQSFEWEEGFVSGDSLLLPRHDAAPFKRDLFSGNVELSIDTKTEGNRSIMIRQDQPLPMTILAIIPFVSVPE